MSGLFGIRDSTSFALALLVSSLALVLVCGCASTNVNPAKPRASTAYLDFYVASDFDFAWDVRRYDSAANDFKILFREHESLAESILRVAVPPGRQKLRITFLNRVISEPAELEIDAAAGLVTPIEVKPVEAGATSVRTQEYRSGGTYRGRYGRSNKIGSYDTQMYRLAAEAHPSMAYKLKEQMPYYAREAAK